MSESEQEFSFKNLFVPLTTGKAIHWIVIIGIIVYANMLFNGFVWDDHIYIMNNPQIRTFNFINFFGNNIFNNAGQYRPFVVTYFALLYGVFGTSQFFYHVIQLILHMINAVLIFLLFTSFFNKKIALFLSLVFLVHPMQVESVSYISASASVLLFFFGTTSLLIERICPESKKREVFAYALLLVACLVKETGILFVLVFLLYRYLFDKKYFVRTIFYCTGILILYFLTRITVGHVFLNARPLIPIARLDFSHRLINIPKVLFYYGKTFFFPATLSVNQQWVIASPNLTNFVLPFVTDCICILGLFGLALLFYNKKRKVLKLYIFFTVWFLVGLILHSQIFPLDMTVADRWFYFDIAGLLGIIGFVLSRCNFLQSKKVYPYLATFASLIILLLGSRTVIRNGDWQNGEKLFLHDIKTEDNFLNEEQLSQELLFEKKYPEALFHEQRSVAYFPNELNKYNVAYLYEITGNIPKAKNEYVSALRSGYYSPDNHRHYLATYQRLSNLLVLYDDPDTAQKFIKGAIKDYPDASSLWVRLSLSEYKLNHHNSALADAKHAVLLSPNNAMANQIYQLLLNNQPVHLNY